MSKTSLRTIQRNTTLNNKSITSSLFPLDKLCKSSFQSDVVEKNQTMEPSCRYRPRCSKLLVSRAYYQNQCFTNCTLETTSHHPSRRRKKHRKLFKTKTQQPRGTWALTRTSNLFGQNITPAQSSQLLLSPSFVFIGPNCRAPPP